MKRLRSILGFVIVSVIIVFLYRNRDKLNFSFFQLDPIFLLISTLLYSIFCFFHSLVFHYILGVYHSMHIPYSESAWIFFSSIQGRYLPGRMGNLMIKYYMLSERRMSVSLVMRVFFVEQGIILLSGVFFVFTLFFLSIFEIPFFESMRGYGPLFYLFFIVAVALIYKISSYKAVTWKLLKVFFAQVLNWSLFVLTASVFFYGFNVKTQGSYNHALNLSLSYCVSIVGGFLAIITPAGLGVREVLFSYLNSGSAAQPDFVLMSMILRSWALCIELTLLSYFFIVNRLQRKEKE